VEEGALLGIVDSHWGGNIDDMKSTTGYAFSLDLVCFHGIQRR